MQTILKKAALAVVLIGGLTAQAGAQEVLVSDPQMCAMLDRGEDVQETGMVLDGRSMFTIEYFCEFDRQMSFDWDRDRTEVVVGYCSEPGYLMPTVFAFQMGPYEPGVVTVWTQGIDEPTRFEVCAKG